MASPGKRACQSPPYPWKDEQKFVFLRILANWKDTHGQNAAYKWPEIVAQFNKETQPPADKGILMNKLGAMMSEYSLWKKLLRSETGLGIDPETGIIMADGLWWSRKIQENKEIKKFRDSGIPKDVEDLYIQIFDGAMATGEHLVMPGMMGIQGAQVTKDEPIEDGRDERVRESYFPLFPDEDEADDGATLLPVPSQIPAARASPHFSASRQGTSFGDQSKRRKTYAQTHEEAAQHISAMRGHVEEFMAMARSYTPPATVTFSRQVAEDRGLTVEQALAELHRLQIEEKIDGGKDFMGFAVTHLGNKENRHLFMGCPTDFLKVAFLEHNFKAAQGKM